MLKIKIEKKGFVETQRIPFDGNISKGKNRSRIQLIRREVANVKSEEEWLKKKKAVQISFLCLTYEQLLQKVFNFIS